MLLKTEKKLIILMIFYGREKDQCLTKKTSTLLQSSLK